jgi:VanZ family protein
MWAIFIFVASAIPSRYLPTMKIFRYDKLIHIGLFLVLGLFVYRAINSIVQKYFFNWSIAFTSLSIVILYGVLDEMHQGFVPGRSVDIWDAIADTIGGISAMIIVYLLSLRTRPSSVES